LIIVGTWELAVVSSMAVSFLNYTDIIPAKTNAGFPTVDSLLRLQQVVSFHQIKAEHISRA
jgi:hypothetical protein